MPLLFAYDKNRFSHDVAQLLLYKETLKVLPVNGPRRNKKSDQSNASSEETSFLANIIDNIFWWCCLLKSPSGENLSSVFETRVDSKWPVQLQRLARVLKFCI